LTRGPASRFDGSRRHDHAGVEISLRARLRRSARRPMMCAAAPRAAAAPGSKRDRRCAAREAGYRFARKGALPARNAERVWLAGYRDLVAGHRELLHGITVSALGQVATDREPIATALRQREPELHRPQAVKVARHLLRVSLALALVRSGWRAEALPGEPLSVDLGQSEPEPGRATWPEPDRHLSDSTGRRTAAYCGLGEAAAREGRCIERCC
jgi:hypothetical protein